MEQTDDSLVAAALGGGADAFCALVRRYQDRVYGVAVGVLADFHLALDAAQEAFLCAWCDLGSLKDARRFGAWLCAIARNTAFEFRRDRERQAAWLAKRQRSSHVWPRRHFGRQGPKIRRLRQRPAIRRFHGRVEGRVA